VDPDLPAVMVVRDHLTQVILNLVLNAIDATDDQGRIRVGASHRVEMVELTVEDDGRGISLADRCRLFQPFFTTKTHGTGLGLFVCRQIVEEFSGTLTFRSELGEGTTFTIQLPRDPATPRSFSSGPEEARSGEGEEALAASRHP
jgi:signal transduction histidine kinase